MRYLLEEYKLTRRMVSEARARANEHDEPILGNVITGLNFSIEYMETGKVPGSKRGITNLSYEQREVPWDFKDCHFIKMAALKKKPVSSLSPDQQELLDDLLDILTDREKEAFELVRGQGYSLSHAQQLMGVKARGTVQNLVARAEKKLQLVVQKPSNSEGVSQPALKKPIQRVLFAEVM